MLAALALAGCLDISTEVDLRRTNDIAITQRFAIDAEAWDFGRGPLGTGQGMFVLDREDAIAAAAAVDGVELSRYRRRETDDTVTVDITYRLRDIAALVAFWEPQGTHNAAARELVLPLTYDLGQLDAEQTALLEELFGASQYTLRVRLPRGGSLESTAAALLVAERQGRYHTARASLSALVTSPQAAAVVLRY